MRLLGFSGDDLGGRIILTGSLMLAISLGSIVVRLWSRHPWTRGLRREDAVLLVAWMGSIGYTIVLFVAVHVGYGMLPTELNSSELAVIQELLSATIIFFFLVQGLATISYGLLLGKLAKRDRTHQLGVKIACAIGFVWLLASFVVATVFAVQKPLPCKAAFITFGTIHATVIVALFCLAARIVLLRWRQRLWTTLLLSLTLALIIIIAIRLVFTPVILGEPDFTLSTIRFFEILTVEINLTIINATVPGRVLNDDETRANDSTKAYRNSIYTLPNSDISSAVAPSKRHNLPDFRFPAMKRETKEEDAVTVGTMNSRAPIVEKELEPMPSPSPSDRDCFSWEDSKEEISCG